METLALNFGHWVTKSVFLMHTELLNNWRPKDNFRFDPISDRQEKNHHACNNFRAAIFVLLFLYFKSRGQISFVKCAVVTRLPSSGKLVPSTLKWYYDQKSFPFFLPILKAYSLNIQLPKFGALRFIRRLFILRVSFGFDGPPFTHVQNWPIGHQRVGSKKSDVIYPLA